MKKLLVVTLSLVMALALTQCKSKDKKSRIVNDSRTAQVEKKDPVESVIVNASYQQENKPNYRIKSYSIEGDILTITVGFKNGCKDEFKLYSTGMFMKSMPPQVNVFLHHNKDTEPCEEPKEKVLKYDISALKYQDGEKVVVNINSFENKVDYVY